MTWNYWITLYLQRHCAAGLSTTTIAAYGATLRQFQSYVDFCLNHKVPDEIRPADVLRYLEYLRRERNNGDSAVNRQLTILKNFYLAIVALGHLLPEQNPLARMPKIKGVARKLPVVLSEAEVQRLLAAPAPDTVLGLRDRAILLLLYGTGIRASEWAQLKQSAVDDPHRQITVTGKGGHQRSLPLNDRVADALRAYQTARGVVDDEESFFRSRHNRGMSRGSIYSREFAIGRTRRRSPNAYRLINYATRLPRTWCAKVCSWSRSVTCWGTA